jgi:hypothetical protein
MIRKHNNQNFQMLLIKNDDSNELVAQEAKTTGISLMPYRKRSNNNYMFDVARSGWFASVCATTIS